MQSPVHQKHVHHKILYLWPGEACWWTIHPASKQRSEGEKVRVGDDLILVSVSSERYLVSHYLGVSTGMDLSLFSACMIIAIKQSWFDFFFLLTACFFFLTSKMFLLLLSESFFVFPSSALACPAPVLREWQPACGRSIPADPLECGPHLFGKRGCTRWGAGWHCLNPVFQTIYTVHFKSQKGRLVSWWCMSQVSHTSLFWQNINVVAMLIEVSWRLSLNCIFGTLKCDIL